MDIYELRDLLRTTTELTPQRTIELLRSIVDAMVEQERRLDEADTIEREARERE